MIELKSLNDLNDINGSTGGIVRLWRDKNGGNWKVTGEWLNDFFCYFFIPDGFYFENNQFIQNDSGLQYVKVKRNIPDVTCIKFWNSGSKTEQSVWKTCDVLTEEFWSLNERELNKQDINTCEYTGLPFIYRDPLGRKNAKQTICYFKPMDRGYDS